MACYQYTHNHGMCLVHCDKRWVPLKLTMAITWMGESCEICLQMGPRQQFWMGKLWNHGPSNGLCEYILLELLCLQHGSRFNMSILGLLCDVIYMRSTIEVLDCFRISAPFNSSCKYSTWMAWFYLNGYPESLHAWQWLQSKLLLSSHRTVPSESDTIYINATLQ